MCVTNNGTRDFEEKEIKVIIQQVVLLVCNRMVNLHFL